ncbi:MATE family efflux transporter [Lactococcus hodotermopsidis]|uniref:MATE family efflux transporter n=1 Tax=Pseudolactococcus hodotermopsidis TaxID=2709157 RepID=A0A6A0BFW5_9LACT|nr:MATE family efflux transporter [Lactococcus hodotermopsidis]GFH43384.1 MATE family efflux transporter [Lactococcus hodotermopsidis]
MFSRLKNIIGVSNAELLFLSWPIFVELFLRVIAGNINVYMISDYSEAAVASISSANQLIALSVFVYGFITVGAQILISHLIGARKNERIEQVMQTGIMGVFMLGLLISGAFLLLPHVFLKAINLSPELVLIGQNYLRIYGGTLIIPALTAIILAFLRTHSYTRPALVVPTFTMILGVIGNYFCLYQPFGLPNFGINGLAWSTAFANTVGLIIAAVLLKRYLKFNILHVHPSKFSFSDIKEILKLGLPSSGESLSYQGAQVVVTMIVASLGDDVLAAKAYLLAITQLIALCTTSMAQGNQIMVGKLVGAKAYDVAKKRGFTTLKIGIATSVIICTITSFFITPIMHIFTTQQNIIDIAKYVILVNIILEVGRATNQILVFSLNACGDAMYSLFCSFATLWVISLPFSYLLAIHFGLGLVGVWIAYAIDECLRGCLMIYRWHSGVWQEKTKHKQL